MGLLTVWGYIDGRAILALEDSRVVGTTRYPAMMTINAGRLWTARTMERLQNRGNLRRGREGHGQHSCIFVCVFVDPIVFQVGQRGAGGAPYSRKGETCPTCSPITVGQV